MATIGARNITKILCCLLAVLLLCGMFTACSTPDEQDTEKTGEDYELAVWQAFWESASDYFGVEYSDYKMSQTAYSFICDNETSDGYTSHYYLIQTAFETENVYGQKIVHKVTARCYYVPEYSNTVYTVYMTCDGETVYFDEETEDWLLGIGSKNNNNSQNSGNNNSQNDNSGQPQTGGSNNSQNNSNNNQSNNNQTNNNQSNNNSGNTSTSTVNDISKLRTLVQELCFEYNRDFGYYNSYINATVNSATSITIEHVILDEIAPDDEGVVEWLEEGLTAFFEEEFENEGFPQEIAITINSDYTIANSSNSGSNNSNTTNSTTWASCPIAITGGISGSSNSEIIKISVKNNTSKDIDSVRLMFTFVHTNYDNSQEQITGYFTIDTIWANSSVSQNISGDYYNFLRTSIYPVCIYFKDGSSWGSSSATREDIIQNSTLFEIQHFALGSGGSSSSGSSGSSSSGSSSSNTGSSSSGTTTEKNNIDDLRYIVNNVCNNYNSGETAYNGTLSATVNSATSVTITHNIPDSLLYDEQENVEAMEVIIQQLFSDTLNDYFPQYVTVTVKTSVAYTSYKPDFEWDNGFSDDDWNY